MKNKISLIQAVILGAIQFLVANVSKASDDITKVLDEYYPDYQLVEPSLFFSEIIKDLNGENPALVIGRFNDDDIDDFAVLLRSRELKIEHIKQLSREYYDGKLVVCHGKRDMKYDCQVLSDDLRLSESYGSYIEKNVSGEIRCIEDGSFTIMKNENESITYVFWNRAAIDYIYQSNSKKYVECTSAD